MEPLTCGQIRDSIWRYIDRELSAPALAEVSAHLKGCAECRGLYEARAHDAKLFTLAFSGSPFGEPFLERYRRRFAGEKLVEGASEMEGARGPVGAVRGGPRALALVPWREGPWREGPWRERPEKRRPRRRLVARLTLAAALLGIGALVFQGLVGRPVGELTVVGGVKLLRGGTLRESSRLVAGDELTLPALESEARLRLRDGSVLVLRGPGRLHVDPESRPGGAFYARLEEGFLEAEVSPRSPDRELRISTPVAVVRVVGTRFTLLVERGLAERGGRTVLRVEEGEVRFSGDPADGWVKVNAETGPHVASGHGRPLPLPSGAPGSAPLEPPSAAEASPGGPPAAVSPEESPQPGSEGGAPLRKKPAAPLSPAVPPPAPADDLPVRGTR